MTLILLITRMTLVLLITFLALAVQAQGFPATADPEAIPDFILGLHPIVWPVIAIGYFALQIADSYIPEAKKAKWPAMVRQVWDWILRNVGHSRNAGSPDA